MPIDPLLPHDDLDRIITRQVRRALSKNLTVQYNKVFHQIQTNRQAGTSITATDPKGS